MLEQKITFDKFIRWTIIVVAILAAIYIIDYLQKQRAVRFVSDSCRASVAPIAYAYPTAMGGAGMGLCIGYESSLRYWFTKTGSEALPERMPPGAIKQAEASSALVKEGTLPFGPERDRPLHLVVADAAAVSVLCSAMNWHLYLVVRSVAQGNPWAVGRGVAGLELTLTPGLGLVAAGLLGICAIVLALVGRHDTKECSKESNERGPLE